MKLPMRCAEGPHARRLDGSVMYKKVLCSALVGVLAVTALAGCNASGNATGSSSTNSSAASSVLDPTHPTQITVWHYYNGDQKTAFDNLITEFNNSVGKVEGIVVTANSQGSVQDLQAAVNDSLEEKVGSQPLPNIFSSYVDTAYTAHESGKLADLSQYFTQDELDQYVDGYLQEGYFSDSDELSLLPVAKSTEVMMINKTDWDEFAKDTGSSLDELSTTEGVVKVAQRYYEWTDAQTPKVANDGKAFYGRDSYANYFVIGMKQMGKDIFSVSDGTVTVNTDKDLVKRLWENYYVPYVKGYFAALGKFRADDIKTGDIIAYTGSSASSMYFPDEISTDDGTKKIDYVVLEAPIMEGGEKVFVQQGAGMAVSKSDEAHEYASCEFLKWFTRKENNLRFVAESSYLPVTKEANSIDAFDDAVKTQSLQVSDKVRDTFMSVTGDFNQKSFYTTKSFENAYSARKVLETVLSDVSVKDRKAVVKKLKAGKSLEDATASYVSDASFDAWYETFVTSLNAAVEGN